MDNQSANWLGLPKYSDEYSNGVKDFIRNAFRKYAIGEEIRCPCKNCNNKGWHTQEVVYDHLICEGPSPPYVRWIYEVAHAPDFNIEDEMDYEIGTGFIVHLLINV